MFPYRLRFGDELRVWGSRGALHGLAQLNEVVRERLEDVQPFSYHKHGDVKVLLARLVGDEADVLGIRRHLGLLKPCPRYRFPKPCFAFADRTSQDLASCRDQRPFACRIGSNRLGLEGASEPRPATSDPVTRRKLVSFCRTPSS